MNYSVEQIKAIVAEAQQAAEAAANKFFQETLNGKDAGCCGFAWTTIYGVKGSTKLGRALKEAGISKDSYTKTFRIWNPSGLPVQNIDTKEIGAQACAKIFQKYGFEAYAGSRAD
jgi:hypothetical protein